MVSALADSSVNDLRLRRIVVRINAHPALGQVQLEPTGVLGRGRVRRALQERSEPLAALDMAPLRMRSKLALVHLLDHPVFACKGRPLNFIVTGGQVHDNQVVAEVFDTPRPPLAVAADKAYDSKKVRQQIKDEGALPVIPSRSNVTNKAYYPKRFFRQWHKIENCFCRIKDWRRIATRYDKLARNFLAAAAVVGALWIKL
jgi:transposase